jgi:hypothetical protein
MHEESATYLSAGLLLVLAFGALLLRRCYSMRQKSYALSLFDEQFHVHAFLLAFALFALTELLLGGVVAYMHWALPQP